MATAGRKIGQGGKSFVGEFSGMMGGITPEGVVILIQIARSPKARATSKESEGII